MDQKAAEGHIYNVYFGIRVRIFQRDGALPRGRHGSAALAVTVRSR